METVLNNPQLNEQQMDMIRLLKKPMPEKYFMQIKRLAVQLLGQQLDDTMEKWEKKNNITEVDYEKLSKEHHRRQDKNY